jgi:hypothetical protein
MSLTTLSIQRYLRDVIEPELDKRGLVPGREKKDVEEGLMFMDNLAAHRHLPFKAALHKRVITCRAPTSPATLLTLVTLIPLVCLIILTPAPQ